MGRTLLDKIWDAHTVRTEDGGRSVLYIDRQYIHEVTLSLIHISEPTRP